MNTTSIDYRQTERGTRILLVEDNPADALLLKHSLGEVLEFRYSLDHATTLRNALQRLHSGTYDIVLLDLGLPDSEGLETVHKLIDSGTRVPAVALTSVKDNGRSELAVLAGAQDYLVKGMYNGEMIVRTIRHAISRKKTEERLKESEQHFRLLIERSEDAIHVFQNNRLVFVNPAWERTFGFSRQEALAEGFTLLSTVAPESVEEYRERLERIAQNKSVPRNYELQGKHKNGSIMEFSVMSTELMWNGEPARLAVYRDITNLKKSQRELLKSEKRYRQIFENANDMIFTLDLEANCTSVNKRVESFGYSPEEVIGRNLSQFMTGEHFKDGLERLHKKLLGEEDISVYETELVCKDGSTRAVEVNSQLQYEEGILCGIHGIARDITERKRVEAELRRSEERFRRLVEGTNAVIISTNKRGVITYANEAAAATLRRDVHQLKGTMYLRYIHPEDRDRVHAAYRSQMLLSQQDTSLEFRYCNDEGTLGWYRFTVTPLVEDDGVVGLTGIGQDITDLKRSEEQLHFQVNILRNVHDVVIVTDMQGSITYWNEGATHVFGYTAEEMLGRTPSLLYPDQDQSALATHLEAIMRGEDYVDLWKGRNKNGHNVWVDIKTTLMRDTLGNPIGFIGVAKDVTDRRQQEEERRILEAQLLQAQKLESLGTLAGGIAHDFNNILGIIMGHVGLIEGGTHEPVKLAKSIEAVNSAVERGAQLTRQILTFARKTNAAIGPVNVNIIIRELFHMLEQTFPKTVQVLFEPEEENLVVLADSNQIHQVLLNLCINARDAMPAGGLLSVSTETVKSSHIRSRFPDIQEGRYAHIIVSDTGTGMDEETRKRIFEPFFTTKGSSGTGLGLAVVYGVVKGHNGIIDVESEPGTGTTFHVYIPIISVPPTENPGRKSTVANVAGGKECILFVEDEELLQELVRSLLQSKGYHVISAWDGHGALELFQHHRDEIDLVMCDLGLPGMSGWDAFKKMRALKPCLSAIFASGYVDSGLREEMEAAGVTAILQKPYIQADVLHLIRSILDGQRELRGS